jgi:hypothetical protein
VLVRLVLSHCDCKSCAYLTTSHTTTTGMLPVLANTSVTGAHMAAVLASVAQPVAILESIVMAKGSQYTHLVGIVVDCVG